MLEKVNKQKLVVIGNGMAGIRTVETLLERAPDLYDITVFGSEPYGNYNRILLSPVLAGEKTVDDIMLNTEQWYDDNGITLRKGEMIAMIDRRTCEVVTAEGARVPYDRLLIATGSNPIMLPIPGKDLRGVIGFRDIQDVERMVEASTSHRNAVVIGGGLLGLEAANGLMKRGMSVTVVHLLDSLMERQLDQVAGGLLRKSLEERGMVFKMPAQTQAILGEDHVTVDSGRRWTGPERPVRPVGKGCEQYSRLYDRASGEYSHGNQPSAVAPPPPHGKCDRRKDQAKRPCQAGEDQHNHVENAPCQSTAGFRQCHSGGEQGQMPLRVGQISVNIPRVWYRKIKQSQGRARR